MIEANTVRALRSMVANDSRSSNGASRRPRGVATTMDRCAPALDLPRILHGLLEHPSHFEHGLAPDEKVRRGNTASSRYKSGCSVVAT
jgi:hypothetical protein